MAGAMSSGAIPGANMPTIGCSPGATMPSTAKPMSSGGAIPMPTIGCSPGASGAIPGPDRCA